MNALLGTPQRTRSAAITWLFATQAVVLRAMLRAKNEPEQPLATNDREVEVTFAAPARLHHDRLAKPLSCERRRKRMQAAVNDVNQVITSSVPPQPRGDADGTTRRTNRSAVRRDWELHAAGSAVRKRAPRSPAPAFRVAGVAQAVSRRPRGGQAPGPSGVIGARRRRRSPGGTSAETMTTRGASRAMSGRGFVVMATQAPPPLAAGTQRRRTLAACPPAPAARGARARTDHHQAENRGAGSLGGCRGQLQHVLAVDAVVADAADVDGDHRQAGEHRLCHDDAKALRLREVQEESASSPASPSRPGSRAGSHDPEDRDSTRSASIASFSGPSP